jgi:dipeptidyl aminopeptidase/acylaminoacyl peptidase
MMNTIAILSICSALTASGATAGKRGLTSEDYYSLDTPGDPHISPDGKLVVYTVTSVDAKQNRRRTDLWLAALDGSLAPWQFTTAESSSKPRWSPDGRALAFVSARRDPRSGAALRPQVYALPMDGGEARRLTDLKNGVTDFQWSPDGTHLACISRIGRSDSLPPGAERSDVRRYVNPEYKFDGKGFYDDHRAHVFLVDVKSGSTKQLSFGDESNDSDPRWSPNGARIAYLSQATDGTPMRGSALYIVTIAGGAPAKISAPEVGIKSLRWSPDGLRLAYIAGIDEVAIPKIWTSPALGGKYKLVSDTVTYATDLDWAGESALCYGGSMKGEHPISRIDVATGAVTPLIPHISARELDVSESAKVIVYTAGGPTDPGDLFVAGLDGENLRPLTHLNAKVLADVDLQTFERIAYKGPDNWDVDGFLMKPLHWQAGRKYPMILMIHGGPNAMWGFQWIHNAQVFAAHGWAVLLTNPRGSSGYGEAFQRGVFKEWGGKAYEDIMAGVDAAIAKYPWIDSDRLGVAGHSFGGFMTEWIVGHTNRFKAAAAIAGISDFISVEGARDGFYGHARDFGADLFDDFDVYWRASPLHYAKNIKTPTILLQGEVDQRVPIGQSEEFFRALRHFNVPAELVIFPHEDHAVRTEPKHVVQLLNWQVYWFDKYVAGDANVARPNAE